MGKKRKIFAPIALSILLLSACGGGEEKEKVNQAKKDFNILYTYDESKILPVIEDEKSPNELAKEYLTDRMGLNNDESPKYKERGVEKEQGIFIESAIYEGGEVPNVSAMDDETKERIEGKGEDRSLKNKEDEFNRLLEERQKVLDEQYQDDNQNTEFVEEEIKKRVEEYEQDSENGDSEGESDDIEEQDVKEDSGEEDNRDIFIEE